MAAGVEVVMDNIVLIATEMTMMMILTTRTGESTMDYFAVINKAIDSVLLSNYSRIAMLPLAYGAQQEPP